MDIRDIYYNMTNDYEGAYGRNEDRGDYMYSEDSLVRAIDAIKGTQNFGEREVIKGSIDRLGPRAGSAIGRSAAMMSPSAGYWGAKDYLSDFLNAKGSAEPYPEQKMDMVKGFGGMLSEAFNPSQTRQMGARYGLIEYLAQKLMGSR